MIFVRAELPAGGALVGCDCGGAGDAERDSRAGDPGGVGRVLLRQQVHRGVVLQLRDDLPDHGVVTMPPIGIDDGQGAVGDEGVVAVDREQLALHAAV